MRGNNAIIVYLHGFVEYIEWLCKPTENMQ